MAQNPLQLLNAGPDGLAVHLSNLQPGDGYRGNGFSRITSLNAALT